MAHLRPQFAEAMSKIEPKADKENAPIAHQAVRDALRSDGTLSEYGVDPVLIGSYKRHVSIRRVKDVDVLARMPNIPTEVSADVILDHFFTVLHKEFGTDDDGHRRTSRQDRSLKVKFPEYDLHVDAVPARQHWSGGWEIPQKNRTDNGQDNWVHTNPEAMTSLSTDMNSSHNGLYVPTVKLLRQTRRALLGAAKPGGFFLETVVYEAFRSGRVHGVDEAEYYVAALSESADLITNLVKYGIGIPDPTRPGNQINVRATEEEFDKLEAKFSDARTLASNALDEVDLGQAALAFRKLLGRNGDGDVVFPMPPGFDDDGTKSTSSITPGARAVPAGRRTFG